MLLTLFGYYVLTLLQKVDYGSILSGITQLKSHGFTVLKFGIIHRLHNIPFQINEVPVIVYRGNYTPRLVGDKAQISGVRPLLCQGSSSLLRGDKGRVLGTPGTMAFSSG